MGSKRSILFGLVNWVLAAGGAAFITVGLWRTVAGDAGQGSGSAAAGLFMLLGATIERFEVLKGFGMEAQTRKLEETLGNVCKTPGGPALPEAA